MKKQIQIYLLIAIFLSILFTSCTKVGHIHGTVKDTETGDLLENAKVEISPSGMSTILTNSTGEFTFADLSEGLYTISVSKDGYTTTSKDFTVNKGNTTNADFSLTPEQLEPPNITTGNVSNISTTTAQVEGNIINIGTSNITEHGHCWNTSSAPTIALSTKTELGETTETGNFTSNLNNLQAETTYYVRAYATNETGTTYGTEVSFTTENLSVLNVTISNATNITASTASVVGNITKLGESNITAHGHCWNNSAAPNINDDNTDYGTANETGEYTSPITNLQPNTTYYVRAFATNSEGTTYSSEISFTTSNGKATVSINNPTNIDYQALTANGNITNLGASNPTQHGFIWSEINSNPTTTNNDGIKELGSTSITGSFISNLTNFTAVTDYYIRAFVTNSYGTEYSEVITFSTKSSFIDSRDNQTYEVVQIGNQIWMKENLAYNAGAGCWAYDNIESNVATYGRLYNWETANSACPSGWDLPSDNEWKTLEMELGMSQSEADGIEWRGTDEGSKLKSASGWYNNGNGTNESGFTALPSGYRLIDETFVNLNKYIQFWTNTSYDSSNAMRRILKYSTDKIERNSIDKQLGYSVRCIKN